MPRTRRGLFQIWRYNKEAGEEKPNLYLLFFFFFWTITCFARTHAPEKVKRLSLSIAGRALNRRRRRRNMRERERGGEREKKKHETFPFLRR